MIFQWLNHKDLQPPDQLLLSLYDHGAFTARQFCMLSGWKIPNLRVIIYRLRKRKGIGWVETGLTNFGHDHSYYHLGEQGLRYASQLRNEPVVLTRLKTTQVQHLHLLGLNDVLVRLVQLEMEPQNLIWLHTREATDYLYRLCSKQMGISRIQMIKPDAYLVHKDTGFWIEYDRATEGPRVIERKMRRYIQILQALHGEKVSSTIVWIAPTRQRKKYLQQIWKSIGTPSEEFIQMHFFREGEESSFFVAA